MRRSVGGGRGGRYARRVGSAGHQSLAIPLPQPWVHPVMAAARQHRYAAHRRRARKSRSRHGKKPERGLIPAGSSGHRKNVCRLSGVCLGGHSPDPLKSSMPTNCNIQASACESSPELNRKGVFSALRPVGPTAGSTF